MFDRKVLSAEITWFSSGFSTEDQQESMTAVLKKRRPIFKAKYSRFHKKDLRIIKDIFIIP